MTTNTIHQFGEASVAGQNRSASGGRVAGKVALVMGAGSCGPGFGNGRASAIEYAREGAHNVVCVDIVKERADETCRFIQAEGFRATTIIADVSDAPQVQRVISECIAQLGRIDVLHNNVGITAMGGPIEESLESWQHVMNTNVTAMFLACKYALPHMLEQKRGAIINISSIAGMRIVPYPYSSYYASKAAVVHFSSHVALQYAKHGIRCNTIAPGLMNTPLIYQQISGQYASEAEMVAARDAMTPTGKMGTGWDVAKAAVFLASDDAGFINGIVLPVDGGQHALVG